MRSTFTKRNHAFMWLLQLSIDSEQVTNHVSCSTSIPYQRMSQCREPVSMYSHTKRELTQLDSMVFNVILCSFLQSLNAFKCPQCQLYYNKIWQVRHHTGWHGTSLHSGMRPYQSLLRLNPPLMKSAVSSVLPVMLFQNLDSNSCSQATSPYPILCSIKQTGSINWCWYPLHLFRSISWPVLIHLYIR